MSVYEEDTNSQLNASAIRFVHKKYYDPVPYAIDFKKVLMNENDKTFTMVYYRYDRPATKALLVRIVKAFSILADYGYTFRNYLPSQHPIYIATQSVDDLKTEYYLAGNWANPPKVAIAKRLKPLQSAYVYARYYSALHNYKNLSMRVKDCMSAMYHGLLGHNLNEMAHIVLIYYPGDNESIKVEKKLSIKDLLQYDKPDEDLDVEQDVDLEQLDVKSTMLKKMYDVYPALSVIDSINTSRTYYQQVKVFNLYRADAIGRLDDYLQALNAPEIDDPYADMEGYDQEPN